jgi:RHS repeat-associated protein
MNLGMAGALQPYQEYADRIKGAEQINVLGDGLMGDSVSLYNGRTEFSVTDVAIPGNSGLPVELTRRLKIESRRDVQNLGGFGIWDIDVPYMTGTFDGAYGWNQGAGGILDRCSGNWQPQTSAPFTARDIGGGITMHLPGAGEQEVYRITTNPQMLPLPLPTDGQAYEHTARDGTRIYCKATTSNGYFGQGFVAVTTSGVRYTFDVGVERYAGSMSAPFSGVTQTRSRVAVYLMASRVEDRFGNWVQYQYTGDKLTAIRGNDGANADRLIELFYDNGAPYITRARANGRQWSYTYTPHTVAFQPSGLLTRAELPDASAWTYAYLDDSDPQGILIPNYPIDDSVTDGPTCRAPMAASDSFTFNATSPSGASGQFTFSYRRHRRTGVPQSGCVFAYSSGSGVEGQSHYRLTIPDFFDNYTLAAKTLQGPGVAPMTWTYSYPIGGHDSRTTLPIPCTSCVSSKAVGVSHPDGTSRQYIFGTLYGLNDGRLLETRTLDSVGAVRKSVTEAYVSESEASAEPFSDIYGQARTSDDPAAVRQRPVRTTTTMQDGVAYVRHINAFDNMARPVSVTRSNSAGSARTDELEYHHAPSLWVMGQVHRELTDGIEVSKTVFDNRALPQARSSFQKLQHTLAHDAVQGTLSTVTDGRGLVTTLSSWKRGVPQLIGYHDATSQSAVVTNDGWIASVTDQVLAQTCYAYDLMGRISQVTYPGATGGPCTPSAWAVTTKSFAPVAVAEYGLPAGHWKQTVSTGNARKVTYFDAFWRPVVDEAYDNDIPTTTRSISVKRYDAAGQVSFQAYPQSTLTSYSDQTLAGVTTSYDALGRTEQATQTSELAAPITTLTTYHGDATGPYTATTNARNETTLTWYQAFDEPSYDRPTVISHPEGAYTYITRDKHGLPESMTRRNASGSLALARTYTYNSAKELCRLVEPETGATLHGYDPAGNLAWSAAGLPASTACEAGGTSSAVVARKVSRAYDSRNRLWQLRFPDSNGDQDWLYEPDGLTKEIRTYNDGGASSVVNSYVYNTRRMLTGETQLNDINNWSVGYGYNTLGQRVTLTYPAGLTLTSTVNALGQTTKIANGAQLYASNASYFPNGALKQFTYGNGIVHTMQQNARQLPARVSSSGGVSDLGYTYDPNGNVTGISDHARGASFARSMTYDGLDRLKTAASPAFGGSDGVHRYSYDVFDNITSWTQAGGKDYAQYYYQPTTGRLTNIQATGGASVVGIGYDDQGNVTQKNGNAYVFDFGNRLRTALGTDHYRYDGHGRRVQTTSANGKGYSLYGQDGTLLWDRDERISTRIHYVHLAGSLIAMRRRPTGSDTEVLYYSHTDALGSPVALTDAAQGISQRSEYDPYGALTNRTANSRPGYTGHVMDATGLTYMQQRYYDPSIGRFLSVDPVTADGNSGGNFNRYWYGNNNPYRFTDPDGRLGCEVCRNIVSQVKAAATNYVVEKTVALGNALVAEGKAALDQGVQDARNFVSQRDVVVGGGVSGMFGGPLVGNGMTPGVTIVADASVVANLSSGQIGLQGNVGVVPSVGGGGVVSSNFSVGLNQGPLQTGISQTNTAFAQATAVMASGNPVNAGGAVQWSDSGGNISVGGRAGAGSYIGAGGGTVHTGTLVTPPLREDRR